MIYLGKINGRHYVFEKPNMNCGPNSRYKIIALGEKLKLNIGDDSLCINYYDTVFAYRRYARDIS